MKTPAAQAAAAIRKHLKAHGVPVRVKSRNFSMGDAVDVTLIDPLPATRDLVEKHCAQYQYGHFDGMQDLYEYSNSRDDIPQAKYVHVAAEYSDELRAAAWEFARGYFGDMDDAPADHTDAGLWMHPTRRDFGSELIRHILSGRTGSGFWRARKERVAA